MLNQINRSQSLSSQEALEKLNGDSVLRSSVENQNQKRANKRSTDADQMITGRSTDSKVNKRKNSGSRLLSKTGSLLSQDLKIEIGINDFSRQYEGAPWQTPMMKKNESSQQTNILKAKMMPQSSQTVESCKNYAKRVQGFRQGTIQQTIKPTSARILFQQNRVGQIRRDDIYGRQSIVQRFANIAKFENDEDAQRSTIKPLPMPFMPKEPDLSYKMPFLIDKFNRTHNCQIVKTTINDNRSFEAFQNMRKQQYQIVTQKVSNVVTTHNIVNLNPKQYGSEQLTQYYDKFITPAKAQNQLIDLKVDNQITVKHSFYCLPLKRHLIEISQEIQEHVLKLQMLNQVDFMDFIAIHQINPKIYMLKCDKNIDLSKYHRFQSPESTQIRERLIEKAKMRQQTKPYQNAGVEFNNMSISLHSTLPIQKEKNQKKQSTEKYENLQTESDLCSLGDLNYNYQPLGIAEISRFETQIRSQSIQLLQRNFTFALAMIQKSFANFPNPGLQPILKFNYGLVNLMLGKYDEAISSYISIIEELKNETAQNYKNLTIYSLHNLILCVGLRHKESEQKSGGWKQLYGIILQNYIELQSSNGDKIKLQKLIEYVKQQTTQNIITEEDLPREFILPQLNSLTPKQKRLAKVAEKLQQQKPRAQTQIQHLPERVTPLQTEPINLNYSHYKVVVKELRPFYKTPVQKQSSKEQPLRSQIDRTQYEFLKEKNAQRLHKVLLDQICEMRNQIFREPLQDKPKEEIFSTPQVQRTVVFPQTTQIKIKEFRQVVQLIEKETPKLDDLIQEMETVEVAMLALNNGLKKFDPVQTYYSRLISAIKSLCENPQICQILLQKLQNDKAENQTNALSILRQATKQISSVEFEKATPQEKEFLHAKIEQIRLNLQEELNDPQLIMQKGRAAQISLQRAREALTFLQKTSE